MALNGSRSYNVHGLSRKVTSIGPPRRKPDRSIGRLHASHLVYISIEPRLEHCAAQHILQAKQRKRRKPEIVRTKVLFSSSQADRKSENRVVERQSALAPQLICAARRCSTICIFCTRHRCLHSSPHRVFQRHLGVASACPLDSLNLFVDSMNIL